MVHKVESGVLNLIKIDSRDIRVKIGEIIVGSWLKVYNKTSSDRAVSGSGIFRLSGFISGKRRGYSSLNYLLYISLLGVSKGSVYYYKDKRKGNIGKCLFVGR